MLYGRVEHDYDDRGNYRPRWVDAKGSGWTAL